MNGTTIFLIINFSLAALFAATASSFGLGIAALLVAEGTVYYLYDSAQRKKKELKKHD